MVDGPQDDDRRNSSWQKDFAWRTRSLFESFGAPLAGLADAPFGDLLRTMASFPTYSLGNQAMISLQAPGSRSLSSRDRWAQLGRRLVHHARAVYLWTPSDERSEREPTTAGYAHPSLDAAERIGFSLGLRAAEGGDYCFDAEAVAQNALWGASQTWRAVRKISLAEGGDHLSVKLTLRDGRVLDRRARTMIGFMKAVMQAGSTPNDETLGAYLNGRVSSAALPATPRMRDFFRRFKIVPVYDVSETDGPAPPEPAAVDFAEALKNLVAYLGTQNVEVILRDDEFGMIGTGPQVSVYVDAKDTPRNQFGYLLEWAADIIGDNRARAQNRELLTVEREAIKHVLATHFGWGGSVSPELGIGLAPKVEPHAALDIVRARLTSIHDIARDIIVAACPGYENPLLKALGAAADPAIMPNPVTPVAPSGPALVPAAVTTPVRKSRAAPVPPLRADAPAPAMVAGAVRVDMDPENFNPFAEVVAPEDSADFNPFADPSP